MSDFGPQDGEYVDRASLPGSSIKPVPPRYSKRAAIGLLAGGASSLLTAAAPSTADRNSFDKGMAPPSARGDGSGPAGSCPDRALDVRAYGVKTSNTPEQNHVAFNTAIRAANISQQMLYLPPGSYANAGTLEVLTAPGMDGGGAGVSLINHLTNDSCVVAKGSHKSFRNFTIINRSSPGSGKRYSACLHLKNCSYGTFENVHTAHDLDNYAGILLEQVNDQSYDDGSLMAHLGCWYNHFVGCSANYATLGETRGWGICFRVANDAIDVVDPAGQKPGRYSGSCRHNVLDDLNIEQRRQGLRLENSYGNQIRAGQFIGSNVQVALLNSSENLFISTKHNQWLDHPFAEDAQCYRNVILYPTLFSLEQPPWSIGLLGQTAVVVRADEKGSWTPRITFGGKPVRTMRAVGSYSKVDNEVSIDWDIRLAEAPPPGPMEVGGLPFSAVNQPDRGVAVCTLLILTAGASPKTRPGRLGAGYCSSRTIAGFVDHMRDLDGENFDRDAALLGSMRFFTTEK